MRERIRNVAAICLQGAVMALLLTSAALRAQEPPPADTPREGWTQIDIWQKGINPTGSPYPRATRCAEVSIFVKNSKGVWAEKKLEIKMEKGSTFAQMAAKFCASLKKCIETEKWQFNYSCYNNSVTIWPVNYDADPDKEGKGKNYPDNKKNRPKVRKESHPSKKAKSQRVAPSDSGTTPALRVGGQS